MKDKSAVSIRHLLQREFLERCGKNRVYSLRGYARALAINPSSLSRILRCERPVSEKMAVRLAARLGIKKFKPDRSQDLKIARGSSGGPKKIDYHQLSEDTFSVISDWYHFAILELTYLKNFRSQVAWIARALSINVAQANAAIERLLRLNLLTFDSTGTWKNTSGSHTNLNDDNKAAAYRKLQKSVLEMALSALAEVPIEERDQTAMTMAINTKRLPEAIEAITEFRRKISAICEQDTERDQVYQLGISLYPLTRIKKETT